MRRNSVLIELTPLLDVILIMLFFILVQSEGRMGDFYEETREALQYEFAYREAELDAFMQEHAEEMEMLRRDRESYMALVLNLQEGADLIMLSIVADPEDPNIREILIEANSAVERINLDWNQVARDAAAQELNGILTRNIQDSDGITVLVFRFDSSTIFNRDHVMLTNAINTQMLFFDRLVVIRQDVRT